MGTHLLQVCQALAVLFLLSIACLGWANATQKLLLGRWNAPGSIINTLWIGWCVTLLLLQVLHLMLAITAWVVIILFVIGILLALP